MPELPEVENLRIGLSRAIVGQKILGVKVTKSKLVSGKGTLRAASDKKKKEFIKEITGEKFVGVERRAKNLIFKLSHGKILLVHLKMSGQFVFKSNDKKKLITGGHPIELSETVLPNKHSHVIFELTNGTLYYNDTRMFGYLLYFKDAKSFEAENHFAALGVEPLSHNFTAKYFKEKLRDKKSKIKTVLMEQKVVTGVGNIYTDESLFESRIRPDRIASSLSDSEIKKLHGAIVSIMQRAIKAGGSSVVNYRLLDNSRGNYAREHKVYGKAGKLCTNCAKPLQKILIQTRTTIFCPRCQR